MLNITERYYKMKLSISLILVLLFPVAGKILTHAPLAWPVSVLLYNFGLLYMCSLVSNRSVRMVAFNVAAAVLFIMESAYFFSYYMQNAGFNDAFFYHLRGDLLYAGIWEHRWVLLLLLVCLAGFLVVSSLFLANNRPRKSWVSGFAVATLLVGLVTSPSIRDLGFHTAGIASATTTKNPFEKFPELQGSGPHIRFSKAKRPNIVLIYAESLEQRYFDETVFPDLLPNLKNLKERSIVFSNVSQGPGAGWTTAGIVASQCGYPLADSLGVGGNSLPLFDEFLPQATCLGDLLHEDSYHTTFIGGADARFAGKGKFLHSHGYNEVIDKNVLIETLSDKSYVNEWGVYDDTRFAYAIEKFKLLSQQGAPFLLTMLTIDTHHPNGFPSRSCQPYGTGENSSLNAVHCSDQLIAGFVDQIRSSPYSENTLIIVLSDHLAMRNQASDLLEASSQSARLTFFVNTPQGTSGLNANPGDHFDIAPTILDLAGYGIDGQIGFGAPLSLGAGYLPGKFGEDRWEAEEADLMAVAQTLWNNEVALDQRGITFEVEDLRLEMGGQNFDLHSAGFSDIPASTLFFFDDQTLKLEEVETFPFNVEMTAKTLARELLTHKDKLTFAISQAGFLPGYAEPRISPEDWVFYIGKPGGDLCWGGRISGDFSIPFEQIRNLSHSEVDARVVRERERLLQHVAEHNPG